MEAKAPGPEETLRVVEIYLSLQGESRFAGLPCVFVRTAFCDLRCSWCDSTYTWEEKGERMSIEAILERVRAFGVPLVEVTGGEPLLWPATPRLVERLLREGFTVLVETSGAWDISVLPPQAIVILDLKPPSSGMTERMHWPNVEHLRPHHEVKFVIADRADYEWAREVVRRHQLPSRVRVVFSPVMPPASPLPMERLAAWILEDRLPVHLQPQLHKLIWPSQMRGI